MTDTAKITRPLSEESKARIATLIATNMAKQVAERNNGNNRPAK